MLVEELLFRRKTEFDAADAQQRATRAQPKALFHMEIEANGAGSAAAGRRTSREHGLSIGRLTKAQC
jgi:hypothetical protein